MFLQIGKVIEKKIWKKAIYILFKSCDCVIYLYFPEVVGLYAVSSLPSPCSPSEPAPSTRSPVRRLSQPKQCPGI